MVPKLRFKEFCGEWEEKRLGEIGFFKNGISKGNEYFGRGYKFVNLQDVFNTNYLRNKNYGLVELTEKELLENNLKKGDVIFVRSSVNPSGVGLTSVVLEELVDTVFAGFLIRFREYEKVLDLNYKRYCFYFPGFRNELLKRSTISANTNINQDNLAKLKINIPSLPEQTKIADFLSTVDDKIQNQQDKITHLENIKKGFMQKIFSRKIRFKDDGGEEFPEWEEKKLGDVIEYITDYVAAGSFADIRKNVTYLDTGYAQLIRTIDLKNNFRNSEFVYVDKHAFEYLYRVNLNEISIILPNVGNVGEVYYIDPNKLPYKYNVLGPNSILLRSKYQNNKFMYYLFSTDLFVKLLKLITGVSGQPKFNKTELKNLKLTIPCIKEQQKIADFLSSFDEKISMEKETLEHLKQLKKGLLQQMFV